MKSFLDKPPDSSNCYTATVNNIPFGFTPHLKDDVITIEIGEIIQELSEDNYQACKKEISSIIARYENHTSKEIKELSGAVRLQEASQASQDYVVVFSFLLRLANDLKLSNRQRCINVYVNDAYPVTSNIQNVIVRQLPYIFFVTYFTNVSVKINWNSTSKKIIYLPGKLYKFDRLLLLKKILDNDSLRNEFSFSCRPKVFSTYPKSESYIDSRVELYDPKFKNWKKWLSMHERELDLDISNSGHNYHRDWEFPKYPRRLMKDHILHLITETWFNSTGFLTEKVYSPIITGMPFIILNDGFLGKINRMGFETYQDRLLSPIDHHEGNKQREEYHIDIMIDRVIEFKKKCYSNTDFVKKVEKIIQHNILHSRSIINKHYAEFDRYLSCMMINNNADTMRNFI